MQSSKYQASLFKQKEALFPAPEQPLFTFIDLFAGIGGFRLGLQNEGGSCLFSSEWNAAAAATYYDNFDEYPYGDITLDETHQAIPKHFDLLSAGFPCQPFSISGKMKGFEDTRGTLIYEVFKIMSQHYPPVVLLENVKHLVHHNSGNTLKTILHHLKTLGYYVDWRILNASWFGVPQNRERVIIIATLERPFSFDYFDTLYTPSDLKLSDFLDKQGSFEYMTEPYTLIEHPVKQKSGLIFAGYRNKKQRENGTRPGTSHLSRVHKQPNRIYSSLGVHPALPSQEASGRFFILDQGRVRKMTIAECYRIMGFPDNYVRNESISEQYKQIGNSVCIPMVQAITRELITQKFLG